MPYALPAVPGLEQFQSYNPSLEEQYDGPGAGPPPPPSPPQPIASPAPMAAPAMPAPVAPHNPWVESLKPTAQKYSQMYGIPPEIFIAINASETNWGNAESLFGIKGSGTAGSRNYATWENVGGQRVDINDNFAAYNSPDDAYRDFIDLVSTSPRYADAWKKAQSGDWQGFLQGINKAGYATDPNWATMIQGLASNISEGRIPASTPDMDSWEGPSTAGAGLSSISGQPIGGRAMPAINSGVDYGPATDEAIARSKLNSASRAIIGNPQFTESNAQFDATTDPANRGVNDLGIGAWADREIPALKTAQEFVGKVAEVSPKMGPLGSLAVIGDIGTALGAAGIKNPLAKAGDLAGSIQRQAAESLVPTRPWEVGLAALPALSKLDDAKAAARAVIGIDDAPQVVEELASLPRKAINAASRRFPEAPALEEGARAGNFLRPATAGGAPDIPENLPDAIVNAAKQEPVSLPAVPAPAAAPKAPIASEGDAVMALRDALREGKGGERASIVSAGRKSQAARIAGTLETSDQSGLELAREAGRSGAGKILPEGGIGFKLAPEADDVLTERAMKLYKEGKLTVFDAVYGVPKALDEGRRLGPTPAQAKLLSKLTDIDEYDFVPFVRQRNVFEKASKENLAAELAKVGEGEAADVKVQLQAAKRAQILADKAAALGKSEQAAKLRNKANTHLLKADQLERASTERYVANTAAKFEREASKAAKTEAEQARRIMEKVTEHSPNPEMILKRSLPPQLGPALGASDEAMDTAKAIIGEHLRGNRAILDGVKDSEGLREVLGGVRAAVTGELSDSYLTGLVYRNMALRSALVESGMEPKTASTISAAIRQLELDKRFPKGIPDRIANELATMKSAPYEESLKGLELGVQRWKNTAFSIDAGIFGGQVLAALRRGNVALLAGTINRSLAAMHLPSVATHIAETGLNKQVRNILDGVHVGAGASAIEPEAGTMFSYLGPAGKKIDQVIGPGLQKLNDVQFNTVLGSMGDLAYEGNLVMMHFLGRDIDNPAVRAVAADTSNSIRSFANTALRSKRGGLERTGLTSAAMTRSQIANILQMSKLLNPAASTEQRIMAAGLIASQAAFYLTVGKFINDQIGVTDFIMDPSMPGFGQIVLDATDPQGRNRVIDLFPQASVDKAIARSFRELAEGESDKALDTWLRYFSGRASPVGALGLGVAGVGYGARGFSKNLSASERLLNAAPLPPIVQSALEQSATGAADVKAGILDWVGVSNFSESTYGLKDREAQDRFGKDYGDLLPSQQKEINELPNIQGVAEQDKKSPYKTAKDAAYGDIQARQDQAESSFKAGTLTQTLPDLWKNLSNERKGARLALQESFKEDLSKFDQDEFDKAVDGYYGLEAKNDDGTTDWDKTEFLRKQFIDGLSGKEKTWLDDFLGVQEQNNSDLRQQYFSFLDKREAAGYFRDGITTAEKSELDRTNPDLDVQTWFFNSGLKDQKNTPALQSAEAVNQALAMNLPGRQVKLAGLGRAVNENAQTTAAWKAAGDKIAGFIDGSRAEKYYETVAKRKYKKAFTSLTDSQQASVKSYINTKLRENNPDMDAYLAWFGKYAVIQSRKAGITLKELRSKYGKEPETSEGPVRYAKGAA